MSEPPVMKALRDVYDDSVDSRNRVAELEAALRIAQAAIAKCLMEGGRLDGGPDADWWPGIVAAQQAIAAALKKQ